MLLQARKLDMMKRIYGKIKDFIVDYPEAAVSILFVSLIVIFICFVAIPVYGTMKVTQLRWSWDIPVYEYTVHDESQWNSAPDGAYDIHKEWEVSNWRTVKTGEWRDENGNTHDITHQEPVYSWRYYYKINKWDHVRDINNCGIDRDPHEAECELPFNVSSPAIGDLKRGEHTEYYEVFGVSQKETVRYNVSFEDWKKIEIGGSISYKKYRFGDKIWDIQFV